MNQFTFTGREKMVLMFFMALGAICLAATYFVEPSTMTVMNHGHEETVPTYHMRFWSNFLQNVVFFLGMSFTAMFGYCAFITAYGGWFTGMKRLWEAYALWMGVGLVMMLVLIAGVWMHWHHLYHWNTDGIADINDPHYDEIIAGKAPFLNKYWYTFATIICVVRGGIKKF